ncbi:MAG: type II toxin-antitoxin system RelE/ParE family toxin [Methylorubrum populi]
MRRRVLWSPIARSDLLAMVRHIAADNPRAARTAAAKLRAVGDALGQTNTGRPGRVSGTYEKSVPGLPYVIAYELFDDESGSEVVAILHVIHTARHWPPGGWPT